MPENITILTGKLHRELDVLAIQQLSKHGFSRERIRKELHLTAGFISNVVAGNKKPCSNKECGKEFYPNKLDSNYGSHECYEQAVRDLGKA